MNFHWLTKVPLLSYFIQLFSEFGKDKGGTMSAALAYTAIFAMAPFLLIVISASTIFFGQKAVEGQIYQQISDTVGQSAANTIQNAIAHTYNTAHSSTALVIGVIGVVLAAAALARQLQISLDTVFDVVPEAKAGFKRTVYIRVKSVALVLLGSVLIAISVGLSALVGWLGDKLQTVIATDHSSLQLFSFIGSLIIFTLILYFVYQVVPDVIMPKKATLLVAFWVALLFSAGKLVLVLIIGHSRTVTAYGAAASLITLLLWFYYSAEIVFLGAEALKIYVHKHNLPRKTRRYAAHQPEA
ncbi:MAG TPA: YihY/virulence factor BrkB family protein [Candidatus Binatia bacterium]|nr:YihY/virulence factor BrkB family protein [Candidatus Binatia bacterium]